MSSILCRLGLVMIVFASFGTGHARADKKVDWSDYLEAPGAKRPKHPATTLPLPGTTTTAAPIKKSATKVAKPHAESRAKATRKTPARPGGRR